MFSLIFQKNNYIVRYHKMEWMKNNTAQRSI